MAYQIDARGLPCPQPVLKTKEALEQAKGSSLVVIIDNEASRDNVIRFLENSGVTVEKVETRGNDFFVHTKETAGSVSSGIKPEDHPCAVPSGAGSALFINKDRIGHGSDELGTNLMKAFITTIKDLSVQPKTICFMNSGVKLTVKEAATLPYLKELEEKGIEMLVCGTCLSYFNLKEQIGVGKISNMYDISETMLKSSKVITL
ncbi:MAG: sulfurtransferase-like selenium metabolism protein YedF [Thermodesulfovibrionales bacterium]|jgi:selenium metabolism protein YedF|nr:sulfurtransferase-like selenium metabolism protein YedF [Thermodesulfovibrionales bacterium]